MKPSALLPIFAVLLTPLAASAQENTSLQTKLASKVRNAEKKNYISLSYENDLIGGGSDQFYTSGVQATWFNVNTPVPAYMDEIADFIPTVEINETTSTFYTMGQNLFTPEQIGESAAQPDDRPWAGFLYASAGIVTLTDEHIDELEATLGIVGPAALGEQTQKFIHSHITSSPTPKGWSNQLETEPGVILSWQRRWPRSAMLRMDEFLLRAEPHVNVSLGNVYTYAGSGVTVSFGPYQSRFQDTPPRVRPAMPGTGFFESPEKGWSWYLFAGLDGRAVARNIFLDGNTLRDSPDVDKKNFVGDANLGAAVTFENYRLSYSYNIRSKEFDGQDEESKFGSLTLTTKF